MRDFSSLSQLFQAFMEPLSPPFLLGFSGGADSMALFHLLRIHKTPFEVAHVDHGWRPESGEEAAVLEALCASKGIPFHLKRLTPPHEKRNLEDKARKERLTFFHELCQQRKLTGVLLGHHADDRAETVLKRVFEGASLVKLKGLTPITTFEGLSLYRPLLTVRKKELLAALQGEGISYFEDPTNHDPRFLRTRLRDAILPALSQEFGKDVTPSLCRLGEAAAELEVFLDSCLAPYRQLCLRKRRLDLSLHAPESPFLLKALLREFLAESSLVVSHATLETLLFHVHANSAQTKLRLGNFSLLIERRVLQFIQNENVENTSPLALASDSITKS